MSRITGEPSIETLLTIGENIVIEFKRAGDGPKHDTDESICAFLNRNGGDVLLGVTDDGVYYHIKGLRNAGKLRRVGGRKIGHWEFKD